VPELPEMQALAERLSARLVGRRLAAVDLLGFSSLKTYEPAPQALLGRRLDAVGRRAKYLVWTFDVGTRIVLHLSQAGRLDIEQPPKKTKPRGAVVRFAFEDGGAVDAGDGTGAGDGDGAGGRIGILVREYGTQRKAAWWVLGPADDGPLAGLGPEPGSPEFADLIRTSDSRRHLTTDLRDQHVVAGIGRGWGDDMVHRARLSPFASLRSLSDEERERLLVAVDDVLAEALALERTRPDGLSQSSLGGRFAVHGRTGEPCPTPCGDTLRRVSFESYEMTYCPTCQTGGKVLADRRLSRLLK
jgi:formamidopyrimidine-DNA glycosylase